MLQQATLTSYDSTNSGRPMNWHYVAIDTAKQTGEKCKHMDRCSKKFDIDKIVIRMQPINESPIKEGEKNQIQFKVNCLTCIKSFPLTSEQLTKKFNEFYGL